MNKVVSELKIAAAKNRLMMMVSPEVKGEVNTIKKLCAWIRHVYEVSGCGVACLWHIPQSVALFRKVLPPPMKVKLDD